MECLRKKRKGTEVHNHGGKRRAPLPVNSWSYLSFEDYTSLRKKSREVVVIKATGSSKSRVSGVVTAPPCGSLRSKSPIRGLKRKIGCIDVATRMGRKKKIELDYDLGAQIGQGKFGSVVVCQSKITGEEFACKTLRKGEDLVHREVEIMQHLSGHAGIVTLKAVYEDCESFYLVMELCHGGRLLDEMIREGQFSEHRAANLLRELISVIKYCHDMGVVHRDVKPENILLTKSGGIKLADFGLAVRIVSGQTLSGVVGSPAYVAPEVLIGEYSEKVDIWSAGVLLHALLVGALPFQGGSLEAVFEAIKTVNLDFVGGRWTSVSQPAQDLIARMLTRDVSSRLSADGVLMHPWILFYTRPISAIPTMRSKLKTKTRVTLREAALESRSELESKQGLATCYLGDDSDSNSSVTFPSVQEEQDGGLVDILAVAVSHMNISEPKRMRLCNPTSPGRQENASNLKANLCTAF